MAYRSIIDRVKALSFPEGEYIIIGSGVMDALGLRESDDVDAVVSLRLFEKLRQQGWDEAEEHGQPKLTHGDAEVWMSWRFQDEDMTLKEFEQHKVVIDGISFVSPQFLMQWKKDTDRPKDRPDVTLLEEYLRGR